MAPLAERRAGGVRQRARCAFHPERWSRVYCHWLENMRDWCISRQIWWGHRIPAWYCARLRHDQSWRPTPRRRAALRARRASRTRTSSTPGSPPRCGPSPPSAGPRRPSSRASTRPRPWSPTAASSTSGSRAWSWPGSAALGKRPFDDVYIHGTVLDERGAQDVANRSATASTRSGRHRAVRRRRDALHPGDPHRRGTGREAQHRQVRDGAQLREQDSGTPRDSR